ncbi:hypothetical protein GCM10010452_72230 [Crossiella cryophila]
MPLSRSRLAPAWLLAAGDLLLATSQTEAGAVLGSGDDPLPGSTASSACEPPHSSGPWLLLGSGRGRCLAARPSERLLLWLPREWPVLVARPV